MRRVILESPYRGKDRTERIQNKIYLQECIRDSIAHEEAPFASHQMYTDALDEDDLADRSLGIFAGYAWWQSAEAIIFYVDLGWSPGMRGAKKRALDTGRLIEERRIR